MKIWLGKEQEGKDIGKLTLFVESDKINDKVIETIEKYIPEDCKRIYFGAGRKDVKNIFLIPTNIKFLSDYDIIIETSYRNLKRIPDLLFYNWKIILTLRTHKELVKKIQKSNYDISFKIDDYKSLCLYEDKPTFIRNLSDLKKNKYNDIDTILYEEKEK